MRSLCGRLRRTCARIIPPMMPTPVRRCARAATVALALVGVACSPTFDWRETQPPDAAVVALFPCKPDRFSRVVGLAGAPVKMLLVSCTAGGLTFALSHAELPAADRVGPALQALRDALAANTGAPLRVLSPMRVPGMTPQPLAERVLAEGRRPDGAALRVQAGFFCFGTRVYQASVVGSVADADTIDTFFSGLRLPR